ncbi:MAG: exodeoxyribonuclease VII large subunit [Bacteroidota bacterium]|nr:exodeoxyribonuclease VII large subunit [Bacteroidota bacterium]
MRANLWKDDYLRINEKFLKITKEPIKDNIAILFSAKIKFHPVYGLSLQIMDIDPSYTLGELEREKQETIEKLKKKEIFENNIKLKRAKLPQRIAIISVETSKGYSDFTNVIENNEWGYKFFHMLFPSLLQGDNAIKEMVKQLKRIKLVKDHFDVVAIIRGGGGDVGLSCYNNYELAREVALFPLPVLSGIGHSTNETVVEMIAHRNNITPTKLAEFLIQEFHNFSVPVKDGQKSIANNSREIIKTTKLELQEKTKYFRSVISRILEFSQNSFNAKIIDMKHVVLTRIAAEKNTMSQHLKILKTSLHQFFSEKRGIDAIY